MTKLVLCASLLVTASSVSVAALVNEPAAATAVKTTDEPPLLSDKHIIHLKGIKLSE